MRCLTSVRSLLSRSDWTTTWTHTLHAFAFTVDLMCHLQLSWCLRIVMSCALCTSQTSQTKLSMQWSDDCCQPLPHGHCPMLLTLGSNITPLHGKSGLCNLACNKGHLSVCNCFSSCSHWIPAEHTLIKGHLCAVD